MFPAQFGLMKRLTINVIGSTVLGTSCLLCVIVTYSSYAREPNKNMEARRLPSNSLPWLERLLLVANVIRS